MEKFRAVLEKYNINLEVIKTNSYKLFFDSLLNKKDFSIYWNKTYEPSYLRFDDYLGKNLRNKELSFKIFKGNILNEFSDIKKGDGTPFKVFTPFWRNAEKFYLIKYRHRMAKS